MAIRGSSPIALPLMTGAFSFLFVPLCAHALDELRPSRHEVTCPERRNDTLHSSFSAIIKVKKFFIFGDLR